MPRYDHRTIEGKWQTYWAEHQTFAAPDVGPERKRYVLDMFPYPSAQGLHVGHPEGYTATDIYCRYLRARGITVLHPMGWDAFGLPAENFAIKTGRHPREVTEANIINFRRQIQALGFSYDWSRELNTADSSYYRWTQWLFLKCYERGLAYRGEAPVNWCPSCQTVLANEQVVDGACERCGSSVEQRTMKQWFLKITKYAEELLTSLATLDWPSPVVDMQEHWIGRSEGYRVAFPFVENTRGVATEGVTVFTTRLDTIFGATFVVLSPERAAAFMADGWQAPETVAKYVTESVRRAERDRLNAQGEKTGVDSGLRVVNPATHEELPVWVADFVVGTYGTGAVFADAHDERDFAFAKKFKLPLKATVRPEDETAWQRVQRLEECYAGEGVLVDSGPFSGLTSAEARPKIAAAIGAEGKTQYKLRDWLISRQRYWGAPIPIIYCDESSDGCGEVPVPEANLPVLLPDDVDFRPTGESPLARSASFHAVTCPRCGRPARRESDTMDTFVDSSWYYLRYIDPANSAAPFDPKKVAAWLPVDLYVGGAEHAVLHLLYARFITKVLADCAYLTFREPFLSLKNQGLILGEDGQKMSKSRGNVVNPDDIVTVYGADTLRVYEMFMGPLSDAKPWNTASISGVRRFLEKVWKVGEQLRTGTARSTGALEESLRRSEALAVKKVTEDIESFHFNTAVSALMILVNTLIDSTAPADERRRVFRSLLLLLQPFAPHLAAELWSQHFADEALVWETVWPTYNEADLTTGVVTIAVQVNGKLRGTISLPPTASEEEHVAAAKLNHNVADWLGSTGIAKIIVRQGKLVNFVLEET